MIFYKYIWYSIGYYLNPQDIARLKQTSKPINLIFSDLYFWSEKFKFDFGPVDCHDSSLELYQCLYQGHKLLIDRQIFDLDESLSIQEICQIKNGFIAAFDRLPELDHRQRLYSGSTPKFISLVYYISPNMSQCWHQKFQVGQCYDVSDVNIIALQLKHYICVHQA